MHILRVDLDDIAGLAAVELRVFGGGITDAVVIIPAVAAACDEHIVLGRAVGVAHGRLTGGPVIDRVDVVLDPGKLAAVGAIQTDPDVGQAGLVGNCLLYTSDAADE